MKYGHNLHRNVVPEWTGSYIDYKALKKDIKKLKTVAEAKNVKDIDLAPFYFAVDRELEKVDAFFNKRLAESSRRLKLLNEKYGERFHDAKQLDRDELSELVGVLLELRSQLRKVSWYSDINRRGFIKILKKLDKKTGTNDKGRYVNSKVMVKPFASATEVGAAERTVNAWLEELADDHTTNIADDDSSEGGSVKRVSVASALGLSDGVVETLESSIKDDNAAILQEVLMEVTPHEEEAQKLLLHILQRAISSKAFKCIDYLLSQIVALDETDDINERNVIHRLVISIGRNKSQNVQSTAIYPQTNGQGSGTFFITPAETPNTSPPSWKSIEDGGPTPLNDDPAIIVLVHLLDHLKESQRGALAARDCHGRVPLHYAAQYGFVAICTTIIQHMQQWGQFNVAEGIDSPAWQDIDGLAPLHLAVIGEHPLTTKLLLDAEKWQGNLETVEEARKTVSKSSAVLALATKRNAIRLVQLLVDAGVDLDYQNDEGETALHIAARFNHVECGRVLIAGSEGQKINLELGEYSYGWTPLFIAVVEGNMEMIDLLVESGADYEKTDLSGWSAQEHASLRGFLHVARKLVKLSQLSDSASTNSSNSTATAGSLSTTGSTPPAKSFLESGIPQKQSQSAFTEPVKSFGHRYLTSKTMILVTLGSKDTRQGVEPIQLEQIPFKNAHATQLDTALSLIVSATNAEGDKTVIDLPVQDSIVTEPITFETDDLSKVRLMFDLTPTYAGAHSKIVGRAVAMLNTIQPEGKRSKVPLQGCLTVPILAVDTLDVIGSINFEFLVITPFVHPQMSVTKNQTYWKSTTTPKVIGHRGLGKNFASRNSLQLGENTLQSFIYAANLGASYVEFDVQLTKDHVPVLYHDFLVGETGIDAPVHSLTLEQFLHVNDTRTSKSSRAASPEKTLKMQAELRKPRSMSLSLNDGDNAQDLNEKMKYTRALKTKGFKANTRGSSIQGPFQTLEGVFKDLPSSIGFNIELKYPMLQESEDEEMDTFGIEMNAWVDAILKIVYDHVKERDLIFSSFNPDICLMLSFKQPSIPVLFLTEAGTEPMADIRASSLKEAIRFASRWNLLGIVSAAEPLVICPRLGRVVKESGLVCVTYGTLNNDTQNVKLQIDQGVDAVIVDNVLAIRTGLTA